MITLGLVHTWALHVHEVRVRRLHQTLELMPASLSSGAGVEEVDGESLLSDKMPQRRDDSVSLQIEYSGIVSPCIMNNAPF